MISTTRMAALNSAPALQRRTFTSTVLGPSVRQHAVARRVRVHAQDDSTSQQTEASPTQPEQQQQPPEELPIWVQREKMRELEAQAKPDLPWPLYLLLSVLVAIAAVGSVFEYFDKNAVFGVITPDSPLWAPILGFFAFTGLPTAGFLFFKGVNAANEAAERQDRMDGYIK